MWLEKPNPGVIHTDSQEKKDEGCVYSDSVKKKRKKKTTDYVKLSL